MSGQPGAMLTWRKDAPLRFRAVARLTDYEREAQLRVKRMVEVTALFESRGWLSGGLPPDLVTGAKEDLTAVVRSFDDSRVAPSREQVAKIVIDCEVQTAPLVDELTRRHLERLQSTAGQLTPIPGPDPAFLFMEGTPPQTLRGLLLYETFSSGTPGRSLEPPLQDGESLAVVIVTLDHQASRASLLARYGLDTAETRADVLESFVPIDLGLDPRSAAGWADRTAAEISRKRLRSPESASSRVWPSMIRRRCLREIGPASCAQRRSSSSTWSRTRPTRSRRGPRWRSCACYRDVSPRPSG